MVRAIFALVLVWAASASAQDAAEGSVLCARTLEPGQVAGSGGAGWPWIWAQVEGAPVRGFNIGVRGAVLFGSPIMSLDPGVGGELAVPMRIRVFTEGTMDVAFVLVPAATLGEGIVVGQAGTLSTSNLGWSGRLEGGVLLGFRPLERLVLGFGAQGHGGLVHTPSAGGPKPVGAAFLSFVLEGLMSHDTLLFLHVEGGIGIAPRRDGEPLFRERIPPFLRVTFGVGYLG